MRKPRFRGAMAEDNAEVRLWRDLRRYQGAPSRSASQSFGAVMTTSTLVLKQQFSPAHGGSKRSLPKRGRRELFFFEGSR